MKDLKELNQKAIEMRCETENEIVSFMLKKNDDIYSNEYIKVSKRKINKDKVINTLLSVALAGLIIYTMFMIPYVFFNGYPY